MGMIPAPEPSSGLAGDPSPARSSPLVELHPPLELHVFLTQVTNDLWLDSEESIHIPCNGSDRNLSKKVWV